MSTEANKKMENEITRLLDKRIKLIRTIRGNPNPLKDVQGAGTIG